MPNRETAAIKISLAYHHYMHICAKISEEASSLGIREPKTTKYNTCAAAVELDPHRNVSVPALWMNPNVTASQYGRERVGHHGVLITVTSEVLAEIKRKKEGKQHENTIKNKMK